MHLQTIYVDMTTSPYLKSSNNGRFYDKINDIWPIQLSKTHTMLIPSIYIPSVYFICSSGHVFDKKKLEKFAKIMQQIAIRLGRFESFHIVLMRLVYIFDFLKCSIRVSFR